MPVTWTKATITTSNPWDGTQEMLIEVGSVRVDATLLPREKYTFVSATADATIQANIEADLAAKGYTWT